MSSDAGRDSRTIDTENGQSVAAESMDYGRGLDIEGKVFGKLTAIRVVGRSSIGSCTWLCRCECGRYAVRVTGDLNRAAKSGRMPMCAVCWESVKSEWSRKKYAERHECLVNTYRNTGSLWTKMAEARLAADIARDVNAAICADLDVEKIERGMSRLNIPAESLDSRRDRELALDRAADAEVTGFRGECVRAFRDVTMTKLARSAEIRLARDGDGKAGGR